MDNIKIESKGLILEGIDKGSYVFIQDLDQGQGAYLILVTMPLEQKNKSGYDHWVESFEDLQEYFKESNWKIQWLEDTLEPS